MLGSSPLVRSLDPLTNLWFCFGFQMVLKIQEIFVSKRGKKRVKLLSPAGKEMPPTKGTELSSTVLFDTELLSGTISVCAGVLLDFLQLILGWLNSAEPHVLQLELLDFQHQ